MGPPHWPGIPAVRRSLRGHRLSRVGDMTSITKILVPVDLSERSVRAAAYAASLAAEFGSELVFLHASQNGWPLQQGEREVRDRISEATDGRRFLFREGPPVLVILHSAEVEHADLILMATQRKPPVARFFGGSITAQLLRGAQCPVWVGPGEMVPFPSKPIRTVLCGVSLGPRTCSVLRWSAGVAKALRARLCVTHASNALRSNTAPNDREWRYWLEKITSLQADAGIDAQVWLAPGKPFTAIPRLAGQLGADLLVIGKSPQKRFLGDLRTLSYEIASRTLCPVASV
jgi:nucleotide-binding universal stress UspA family protein